MPKYQIGQLVSVEVNAFGRSDKWQGRIYKVREFPHHDCAEYWVEGHPMLFNGQSPMLAWEHEITPIEDHPNESQAHYRSDHAEGNVVAFPQRAAIR